jgi:hypothetical protein
VSSPAFAPPGPALSALGTAILAVLRVAIRLGLRLSVTGVERLPDGPTLIAPNHTSYFDPLAIAAAPVVALPALHLLGRVGRRHACDPAAAFAEPRDAGISVDPAGPAYRSAHGAQLLAQGHTVVWFRRTPLADREAWRVSGRCRMRCRADGFGRADRDSARSSVAEATRVAAARTRERPFGPALEITQDRSAADIRATLESRVAALLDDTCSGF